MRHEALCDAKPLLDLIEQRFGLTIDGPQDHLHDIYCHYKQKQIAMLEHSAVDSLTDDNYAKAVMVSEAARMMLREIMPRPKKKKKK